MTNSNVNCPKCGKSFQTKQALNSHNKAKHKRIKIVLRKSKKYRGMTPTMLKALGDEFYKGKNLKQAKDLYESYLKSSPEDVELRNRLSKLRYLFGDHRKYKRQVNKKLDGPKKIEKYPSEKKDFFPYPAFRTSQEKIIQQIEESARLRKNTLLVAPNGTGNQILFKQR